MTILIGTIKFFDWREGKCYGFAQVPGLAQDVYIHLSNFGELSTEEQMQIDEGVGVIFELCEGKNGYRAGRVSLASTSKVVPLKRA